MNCPRCNKPTVVRKSDEAAVDLCERCSGMFLHRGELNKIAGPTSGDIEFSTVRGDSFRHDDAFGPTSCPQCVDETMKKVDFNIYTNIILDYCERCRGFWLDGREIDRINDEVRTLNEAANDQAQPPMLWLARFLWTFPR